MIFKRNHKPPCAYLNGRRFFVGNMVVGSLVVEPTDTIILHHDGRIELKPNNPVGLDWHQGLWARFWQETLQARKP